MRDRQMLLTLRLAIASLARVAEHLDRDLATPVNPEIKASQRAPERKPQRGTQHPLNGAFASAKVRAAMAVDRKAKLEALCKEANDLGWITTREIVEWLDFHGHRTSGGKPWTASNVRRVMGGTTHLSI